MGAFVPWGGLAIFVLTIGWVGVVHALGEPPKRHAAELEDFNPAEALGPFQSGPLTGWYVYVDVGEERVVCANPQVWDGPKVITCRNVVAIEAMPEPGPESGPAVTKATPPFDAFVPEVHPPGEDPHTRAVQDEIDLIMKRLTWEGRNAERR